MQGGTKMSNTLYVNTSGHGSLTNAMYDQTRSNIPEVGMGVTQIMWSDLHPYTIIKILTSKRIMIQEDQAKRIDGNGYYSESQGYEYTPNPGGETKTLFLNKHGKWKERGHARGSTFLVGIRKEYRDPTF
jgi:hypothetical protein